MHQGLGEGRTLDGGLCLREVLLTRAGEHARFEERWKESEDRRRSRREVVRLRDEQREVRLQSEKLSV